jgi:hypothetical protein
VGLLLLRRRQSAALHRAAACDCCACGKFVPTIIHVSGLFVGHGKRKQGRARHRVQPCCPSHVIALQVWGPSGKVICVKNANELRIQEHVWWLLRTTGCRYSKWGSNVERHTVSRPSIQGLWDPATAARSSQLTLSFSEVALHPLVAADGTPQSLPPTL